MKKNKKIIIIIAIVVAVIALLIGLFFILKKPIKKAINKDKEETKETNKLDDPVPFQETTYDYKKKTLTKTSDDQVLLTFDSAGGKEVDDIIAGKNERVSLPIPERNGYIFTGWVTDGWIFMDKWTTYWDTNFTATWLLIANIDTMKIKFDTNDKEEFRDRTVACNMPLSDIPYSYVDGYIFKGWYTKEGVQVKTGSILECKDTTLYAFYEKEGKHYNCPDGANLYDSECVKVINATDSCPSNTAEFNNVCIDEEDKKTTDTECPIGYIQYDQTDNDEDDDESENITCYKVVEKTKVCPEGFEYTENDKNNNYFNGKCTQRTKPTIE